MPRRANLAGPRAKIDRAYEHIAELERRVVAFRETDHYELVRQPQPNRLGWDEWVCVRVDPVPSCIALSFGDVVHNLRSAFDLLAWQLVIDGGNRPVKGTRGTAFNVYKSRQAFIDARFGHVKGITDQVKEVMCAARPYKRGNKTLWRLNQLDLIDKHRLLVTAAASRHALRLSLDSALAIDIPLAPILKGGMGRTGGSLLKHGYSVFSLPRDSIQAQDPQFAAEIVVNERGLIKAEPVVGLAVSLADESKRLVESFGLVLR